MQKLIQSSFAYAIVAMVGGVFYREFTKFMRFTGTTTLSVLHTHLFILGMMFCLLLAIFCKLTNIAEQKKFTRGLPLYHAGVILTVIMLVIRGVLQVLGTPLSKGADAAISGFAGIGHILLGLGLVFILLALKAETKR